jgi:hypothetical protein
MNATYMIPEARERDAAEIRNAEVALGLMGASVGLAFGLAGGLARASARAGVMAGILGLVLCTAAGAGAAQIAVPLANRIHLKDPGSLSGEMISSLLVHGLPWAAIGAVGGLAFGIGLGGGANAARALLGGLIGALAGAVLYEILGALVLPGAKIIEPVAATWGIRLLAQCVAAISLAAGVAMFVSGSADRKVANLPDAL